MSHTVHPYAHRLGILRDWKSRWFARDAKFREFLKTDVLLRRFLEKRLRGMYVSGIEFERNEKNLRVIVKTSRPGMIIGRSGEGSTKLKNDIVDYLKNRAKVNVPEVRLDIEEVRSPESNAVIIGHMVVEALEKRLPFRRVLKQTVEKAMANRDVKGVRIALSGRLGGADMARKEELKKGRIPLQTFRADIDFARVQAKLPLGIIGVKVWVYRGDVFEDEKK